MSLSSAADAYDLLAHAAPTTERLQLAQAELCQQQDLERERAWLDAALQMLEEARAPYAELLKRAVWLPELAPAREDYAREVQNQWVDTLEKLQAGITYHAGSRAPILETLYPKQKLPTLRRAAAEVVRAYNKEFEKRCNGSYVQRMLGSEDFAFAQPILDQLTQVFLQWESLLSAEPPAGEEMNALREELIAAAQTLATPLKQARLLAEAALAPLDGAFDRSGIGAKIKRRSLRLPIEEMDETSDGETEAETEDEEPRPASKKTG